MKLRRIRSKEEELATLMCKETGKPIWETLDCIEWVAACFDYYAEWGGMLADKRCRQWRGTR